VKHKRFYCLTGAPDAIICVGPKANIQEIFMTELPVVPALSVADFAALDAASDVLAKIGAKHILSMDKGNFSFIFQLPGAALVSGHANTIGEALKIAIEKYADYREKPRPITSAVEAVNLIRERLAAGEDPAEVLDSINVA